MIDITPKNIEAKIFIPYKVDTFKTLQYKDLELLDFDDVIDKIEEYVKNLLINKRNREKRTMKKNNNNNQRLSRNNNISIGIDIDERKKIKIYKMKGDSLVKYYNNLVNKLKKFLELVNNKIDGLIGNDDYIKEDQDKVLTKFFSKVISKYQPNCSDIKYKKGFSNYLPNKNASEINQEMNKELEKCLEHLLKIIIDYCMATAILTNETQSLINIKKDILFFKEETEKEKIKRRLKYNSNNTQQYQQQYQPQYQPQYQQQYQQQYQPQYRQYGNFRGGKKTKKIKRH